MGWLNVEITFETFCDSLKAELNKLGTIILPNEETYNISLDAKQFSFDFLSMEVVKTLAQKIHNSMNGCCYFLPFVWPSSTAVNKSRENMLYMRNNIIIRNVHDFLPGTDNMVNRYDVLVIPGNKE